MPFYREWILNVWGGVVEHLKCINFTNYILGLLLTRKPQPASYVENASEFLNNNTKINTVVYPEKLLLVKTKMVVNFGNTCQKSALVLRGFLAKYVFKGI